MNANYLLSHSFHGSVIQAQIHWVLVSGFYKAAIEISGRARVSSEDRGPLPNSHECWQNSFLCSYRTHSGLPLPGQQEKASLTSKPCFIFSFLFYIGVQLINNAVIVAGAQQRNSAIHIHVSILPQTLLSSRLPQH